MKSKNVEGGVAEMSWIPAFRCNDSGMGEIMQKMRFFIKKVLNRGQGIAYHVCTTEKCEH